MTKKEIKTQLLERVANYRDEFGNTGTMAGLPKELRSNAVIVVLVEMVCELAERVDGLENYREELETVRMMVEKWLEDK